MLLNIISWITLAITIIAVELSARKNKYCWILYVFADISWTIINILLGIAPQAIMHMVFTVQAFRGYRKWKSGEKDREYLLRMLECAKYNPELAEMINNFDNDIEDLTVN